jgi:tetratricopeptide (TPR) repeat protein
VASNRATTLKNAEKLLRQGKLDLAIAEYVRLVDDDPRDWNTANILGDLYMRAGKTDKAVEQYIRIADHLNGEGFLSKAGALYKKILKIKPDYEHALLQAAEIAGSQGLLVDARTYMAAVLERRRGRGDERGVAQIKIRLASIDPEDVEARFEGARARLQLNDPPGAVRDFKELAAELAEKGQPAEAIEALRQAAAVDAEDPEIRERLLDVYFAAGDYGRARQCASTVEQFKGLAARLEGIGKSDEAIESLREAARIDPSDGELKAHLAKTFVARGDLESAAEFLTVESAGGDPKLLFTVAEIQLRSGRVDEGLDIIKRLLAEDPERRQDVAMLGWAVAEQAPDAAFRVVELAADQALSKADWPSAAAALQEFVTRVPSHVPALMRLVEICVDGGLEATMYSAQAQLADAYIAAGHAAEALFIAEDLVAREPWDRANVERFRRALVLMGEADPDAVIAARLSGQSPFISTDLGLGLDEEPDVPPRAVVNEEPPAVAPPVAPPAPIAAPPMATPPPMEAKAPPRPKQPSGEHFELSADGIDLESILGEIEKPKEKPKPPPVAHGRSESVEVDLSIVLDDINKVPPEPPQAAQREPADLDDVFAHLRGEAGRQSALDVANEEYRRGLDLHAAGKIDECIPALQTASRAPRLRFATASLLGRIYLERGMTAEAIDWFERAREAPPSSVEEGSRLLYDLAATLESIGEVARALAVFMELQSEAGDYRDVAARVGRLSKVQARG